MMNHSKVVALECAKEYGFTAVREVGTYDGYFVFAATFSETEVCFYGPPRFVLVKDGKARMTTIPEGEAIGKKL